MGKQSTPALRLGEGFTIPPDAVTQTFAILAKRGSGKTYTAAVLTEELIGAHQPVVVLDPVGVWWGLRSSADGKREGLPVIIFGGERGDVPLESTAGAVIAEWLVSDRRSAVIDLSLFRKAEQRRFVEDFALELYRRNKEPLHVVLDEADAFAPQRPMPGEQAMLGAIEDLVRRGRARGLGVTLITQRPAVLHKDVLTQTEVLVALRMTGPQDRDAVDAWIKHHGDEHRAEVLASLPSLPIGTAWFWSPGWLNVLKRVQVRKRQTFDSSSTPKIGGQRAEPKKLAPVDLDALNARIRDTVAKAKADNPKTLRARIAELEQRLADREIEIERVEVPVLDVEQLKDFERDVLSVFAGLASDVQSAEDEFKHMVRNLIELYAGSPKPTPSARPAAPRAPVQSMKSPAAKVNGASSEIGGGLRRMMIALAQRPEGLTRVQLGLRAGLSPRTGTFATYLSRARSQDWIEKTGERFRITSGGRGSLGDFDPLPTGAALLEYWLGEVGGGAARMLRALADAYPRELTREELGKAADLSPSTGTFATYLSRLRGLELIEGRGTFKMSEELS